MAATEKPPLMVEKQEAEATTLDVGVNPEGITVPNPVVLQTYWPTVTLAQAQAAAQAEHINLAMRATSNQVSMNDVPGPVPGVQD